MTNNKLKLLDLFSGIGGFSLGLERTGGFETVAFCEYDEKAQKVLKKHWPDVPIFKDVRNMNYDGTVDIITGGYPCQPFSVAGKRKGKEDDRHLWPAMFKLIQKHRPTWVIGENVAGHINMGLDSVLADLESDGYNVRTFLIPAVAVNAPHRRDRVWIVAHTASDGSCRTSDAASEKARRSNRKQAEQSAINGEIQSMAHTKGERKSRKTGVAKSCERSREMHTKPSNSSSSLEHSNEQWAVEPAVGRVAHGVPRRMDRLKQLGNAVVPQIPEILGNAILEVERKK